MSVIVAVKTQSGANLAIVSVKDFGACGNDVCDDRPAIQAAINAACANGGGTILFPDGTYLMSSYQPAGVSGAAQGTWANLRIQCNNIALQLDANASLIQTSSGLGPLVRGNGGTYLFAIGYDLTGQFAENVATSLRLETNHHQH